MKKEFLTCAVLILTTLLGTSYKKNNQEENETLNKISDANRLEISIIPVKSSEISFKAKIITNKNQIREICDLENGVGQEKYFKTFPNLPDGYLSFYKDSVHIQNIYFVLDSSNGYFQFLENGRQKLIGEEGYKLLKRIYDDKNWMPREIEAKE